jgi:hypothetical protein
MEHRSSVNDEPMVAQRADNRRHNLDKTMALFNQLMPLVVAVTCLSMAEKLTLGFLERDAEKALGRPLTTYDRMLLRKEYERKQACGWLVTLYELYDQRLREDEIIRRVVWRPA